MPLTRPSEILVVDDNRIICADIKETFKSTNVSVTTVYDALHANDYLNDHRESVAAMVLDWMLPGKSGFEFLCDVKRQAGFRFLPVIMMTGRSNPDDVSAGIDAGALYYVTKPFDSHTLRTLVQAAISDFGILRMEASPESAISLLDQGRFYFRDLKEAGDLASLLAWKCQDPYSARLGLHELLINAVEHGNLEISHSQKTTLLRNDQLKQEIKRRLEMEPYRDRRASIAVSVDGDRLTFEITDEGPGFDFQRFLSLSPDRAFSQHGRGIAIARNLSFDSMQYIPPGNTVLAITRKTETTGLSVAPPGLQILRPGGNGSVL